jgi:hypothetical protein
MGERVFQTRRSLHKNRFLALKVDSQIASTAAVAGLYTGVLR